MPSISDAIKNVKSFSVLPVGWHFGEGVPLDEDVKNRGLKLLSDAESFGFDKFDAFPGIDGELQITFHSNDYTAAFTMEINGTVGIVEDENGVILSDREGISDAESRDILWEMAYRTQITSESSIPYDGARRRNDSPVWRLDQHQTQAYLLSILNAFSLKVAKSAVISKNTIRRWRAAQSSSGASRPTISPKGVGLRKSRV